METPAARRKIAGIVLTGGLVPHMAIMPLIKSTRLPVLLCNEDTFTVSSKIAQWVFKISPRDAAKISAAQSFVRDYVDVDSILEALDEPQTAAL
jgi:BioD-like phosphotransacetylase family protein